MAQRNPMNDSLKIDLGMLEDMKARWKQYQGALMAERKKIPFHRWSEEESKAIDYAGNHLTEAAMVLDVVIEHVKKAASKP